ncbi:MAG: hypothetical protein RMI74_03035 [Thermodesulfobacterium sp.]|nr:hypothetical protein [Thermodesulfobacterium sp.]
MEINKEGNLKGKLISVYNGRVLGWVYNMNNLQERLKVSLYVNDKPVSKGLAILYREDLYKNKIGDGKYGFSLRIPDQYFDGKEHTVKVKVEDYEWFLPETQVFKSYSFDFAYAKHLLPHNHILNIMKDEYIPFEGKELNIEELLSWLKKEFKSILEKQEKKNLFEEEDKDLVIKFIDPLNLSSYKSYLYLYPYIEKSYLDYVYLEGKGLGSFKLRVLYRKEKGDEILYEGNFTINEENFTISPIFIKNLYPESSFKVEIEPIGESEISFDYLLWRGGSLTKKPRLKFRIFLLRTYEKTASIFYTLIKLKTFVKLLGPQFMNILNRFIFMIYDTSETSFDYVPSFMDMKVIYFCGNNYGGGGNLSFMAYLMKKLLEDENFSSTIDEVIILDDDVLIDPVVFFTIDSNVAYKYDELTNTGIMLTSLNEYHIQDFGQWWGKFVDFYKKSSLDLSENRLPFPILFTWHKKILNDERNIIFLSRNQPIEYSAFVYLSIPIKIFKKFDKFKFFPIFLRGDDIFYTIDMGLDNFLFTNQNIYYNHEPTFTPLSFFWGLIHYNILNWVKFKFEMENFVIFFIDLFKAAILTNHYIFLEILLNTLYFLIKSDEIFFESHIFELYKGVLKKINNTLTFYHEIPYYIVENEKDKIEIVEFEILRIAKILDLHKKIVFYDRNNDKYYILSKEVLLQIEFYIKEIIEKFNFLIRNYSEISMQFKKIFNSFNLEDFWNKYFEDMQDNFLVSEVRNYL